MGKAALDLPDPLQAAPGEARTSADDLLAQLAGDEIDRLLAEAEAGEPKAARAPFHVGPPPNPKDEVETPAAPPQAPVVDAPPVAESPAVEAEPPPPTIDDAAEMDALFSAAVAKDEAAAAAAVAQGVAEADAETSAAERAGLATPAGVASPAAAPKSAGPLSSDEYDDAPLPFYLRPLEWLNAPLAILPQPVRDVVGKIAIVTLLNAAAILAYVLVVRRMK